MFAIKLTIINKSIMPYQMKHGDHVSVIAFEGKANYQEIREIMDKTLHAGRRSIEKGECDFGSVNFIINEFEKRGYKQIRLEGRSIILDTDKWEYYG